MNHLYPIFLKVHEVSREFSQDFLDLASTTDTVTVIEDVYHEKYLGGKHIVIAATDDKLVNRQVRDEAKERFLLVNVADTPDLCDFYLGGIVTKGNLKIAISTNGKSPTAAKRLRQLLEEVLPEEIDDLLDNLNAYRDTLKGDFEYKVKAMNEITEGLVKKGEIKNLAYNKS